MTSSPTDGHSERRALAGLFRGGVANVAGTGVSAVCQFAVVVLVTRMFPATAAGTLFAATSIFLIVVAIVELGLDQGIVRFIAWLRARGDAARLHALLPIALVPAFVASLLGGLALAAFAPTFAHWFGGADAEVVEALRLLALAVPFAALTDVLLAATRGFGVMRPTVVVERVVRSALQPLAILAVGLSGTGLVPLTLAWAAPYVVSSLGAAIALRRLWLRHRAKSSHRPTAFSDGPSDVPAVSGPLPEGVIDADGTGLARSFWTYTSARAAARIFQVLLQRVDVILVAALLGTREAAVYTAATRFIAIGQLLNVAIQQVIQPRLAELLALGEHVLTQMVLRKTTVALVALAWPGYLAVIALSPWLMGLFGPGYEEGSTTLVVLSFAMLIATATGPLDVVLLMAGRSTISLFNMLAGLVVDVVGCLVLLPHLGLTGAAWAWAAAIVVRNGLGVVVTKRALRLTAWSRELLTVGVWAVAFCGLLPMPAALLGAPAVVVVALLVVGGGGYALLLGRRRVVLGFVRAGAR